MSVHEFPISTPLTDVPGRLRKLAQQIESGEREALIAVVVLVDGQSETAVLGFGEIGKSVEAIGWLARALRSPI